MDKHCLYIPMDPYLFYEVAGGFAMNRGPKPLDADAQLVVGDRIPLSCMFEAHWLLVDGAKVGYYFRSDFQVINGGGYLCAFMAAHRGTADKVEILLKTEDLVVFHYPSKGSMIVSPHVGEDVATIFSEQ